MTPVYLSVTIDLRKQFDRHENISKLSPTEEFKQEPSPSVIQSI